MSGTAAPDVPPLAPGTEPVPGYRILAGLTRTGWLDVYDAWSEERDCRCVIKTVRPDLRGERRLGERLLQEGRWLREFTHPHLVRGYDVFASPEPLVVLETLTGETLSHLLHRLRRRPSAADVALLGMQLCSAVHYLHGRGLLHLDLKPSNVVVDRGHAKVLDLSVARPAGPAPAGVGTCCYRAPEQARGGTLTAAADVWGIGITLFEVACGEVPFDCGATAGTTDASCAGDGHGATGTGGSGGWCPRPARSAPPIASRRRLPPPLAAAVDSCLRADPSARPGVAGLAAALEAALPVRCRGA
ncbi:serine/threonine-protein kinase [Streptomyces sp. NPDC048521]|uniref:serine/threonine-protein kinase n=1 Tax=Streptomyces sp. NPDC048521 TaxID=3365566 RepID=UPI003717ECCA